MTYKVLTDPDIVSPAAATPVLEFLHRHAPFDRMPAETLLYLAGRLKLSFHAKGETVGEAGTKPASTFYLIKQGRVRGQEADANDANTESAWELTAGECFPIGALTSNRPTRTRHVAAEDTFCFELPRADFNALLKQSPVFADFCTRRLAALLERAQAVVHAQRASRLFADANLTTPLKALLRRGSVTCGARTNVKRAVEILHRERVGSVVVVDGARRPIGIFTLHDLARTLVRGKFNLRAPLQAVMTKNPVAIDATLPAYEAALLMSRHGIGHLPVMEKGRLIGVVSERDLFSLQRVGLSQLTRAIAGATALTDLKRAVEDAHRLIEQMWAQGLGVAPLTQLITLLNDRVSQRLIILHRDRAKALPAFTWVSFGSEGRLEQTLKTDQDNGIVFEAKNPNPLRKKLLSFAKGVNQDLAVLGFPLCPGRIMASNPDCCLMLAEWQEKFSSWIDGGSPQDLLNASIFFDFRALEGSHEPLQRLRRFVLTRTQASPRFLRMLAENALANRPPLGFVRDFLTVSDGKHRDTINLKLNGTTPFVDGARVLALAHGIPATNTLERFRAFGELHPASRAEATAWADAFSFMLSLRVRVHEEKIHQRLEPDNFVNPDTLSELDRRILKEAFRQARKLQSRLALDYGL